MIYWIFCCPWRSSFFGGFFPSHLFWGMSKLTDTYCIADERTVPQFRSLHSTNQPVNVQEVREWFEGEVLVYQNLTSVSIKANSLISGEWKCYLKPSNTENIFGGPRRVREIQVFVWHVPKSVTCSTVEQYIGMQYFLQYHRHIKETVQCNYSCTQVYIYEF